MEYTNISDWPRVRRRYQAFWRGEVADRRIVAHVQNPNSARPAPEPWMLSDGPDKYTAPEKLWRYKEWQRTAWNWHADLFDYTLASWGPNMFAAFIGGRPRFGASTVWHDPVIAGLDEADRIRFDPDNPWWRRHMETAAWFAGKAAGRLQLGATDMGGPADWAAALMPAETFFVETLEKPDAMRAFALRLAREANQAFDMLYPVLTAHNDGFCNWLPVWGEGRIGVVQDDISMNLSPELYAEVFLPALREIAGHTELTVCHWHDGCAQHLDALLGMPELDLIQYGHDPNTGPFREHLPAMRKIQAAGKKLFISCVESEDVRFFVSRLDPRGLMMIVNTPDDEASRRMIDRLHAWTSARLERLQQGGRD